MTSGHNSWTFAIWDNIRERAGAFDGSPGHRSDLIFPRLGKHSSSTACTSAGITSRRSVSWH
jgi:hypothetical protein